MTRAIILAAGLGSRLRPLTNDVPKPLLPVNNEPMIERQIKFLHEKNIHEIYIVTGYKSVAFEYLIEKYNVEIIFNKQYLKFNNLMSLYLVRDKIMDSFIIEGDVFIRNNIFKKYDKSVYLTRINETNKVEWLVESDEHNRITSLQIMESLSCDVLAGISYWNVEEGKKIQTKLEKVDFTSVSPNILWDELVKESINEFEVYNDRCENNVYEIDDLEEYYGLIEKISR